jgi:hypothetical protein
MREKVDEHPIFIRGEQIRFGSAFTRKRQPNQKKKRDPKSNWNRPKPAGSGPVSVTFFIQKTGQTYRLILGFLIGFLIGFLMGF